ncbi:hypothetical protein C0389_01170 [bacterium]|nr:hypothetical protein [bacterium]
MKRLLAIIIFIILVNNLSAQWDISLSMGLDFKTAPSFRDYINTSFAAGNNIVPSFKSAISFSGEADYKLSNTFALGLEYDLLIDSYTAANSPSGIYEITYTMHRPSLMIYYIVPGSGYQFKFGSGAGPRFVSLSEKIITSSEYSVNGYGFVLKAEGNTLLGKNFYALIGINIRYDVTGEVSNKQNALVNKSTGETLNLNAISFGIYLGVTFTL